MNFEGTRILEIHTDVSVLVLRNGSRHKVLNWRPYEIGQAFTPELEAFAKRAAKFATKRLVADLMIEVSGYEGLLNSAHGMLLIDILRKLE